MKTKEQILEEIQSAMVLNRDLKVKCNIALSDAISLIQHNEKEMQERLEKEYKRGVNDAWEIARDLCNTDYDECNKIFGNASVEPVIKTYTAYIVKEKIESYREEKENKLNKIHVGDVVQDNNDNTKATVLDLDTDTSLEDENYWMVFTENGCVETWCENVFTKTGESVDVCGVLIK